jgi:hypothetical protein
MIDHHASEGIQGQVGVGESSHHPLLRWSTLGRGELASSPTVGVFQSTPISRPAAAFC